MKIKFTPEYEHKLKELDIEENFKRRVYEYCVGEGIDLQDHINEMNEDTTWLDFVKGAFLWNWEEAEYWNKIASK